MLKKLLSFLFISLSIYLSNAEEKRNDGGQRISLKDWKFHPWCNQPFRGPVKNRGKDLYHHLKVTDPEFGCHLEMIKIEYYKKSYEEFHQQLEDFLKPDAQIDYQTFYFGEDGLVLAYHTKDLIYPRPNSGIFILGLHQISKKFPDMVDKYDLRGVKLTGNMWLVPKGTNDIDNSYFVVVLTDLPPEVVTPNKLLTPREYYATMLRQEIYWKAADKQRREHDAKKASSTDL